MSLAIVGIFAIMILLLILLILDVIPIDVLGIGLLLILWYTGYVDGAEAVAGFSNKAVLTVAAMFVLSHALVKTGVMENLAQYFIDLENKQRWLGMGLFLVTTSLFSGFINNVAAVAIFIPVAMQMASKFRISPSKILIPLSYAAIYGGTITLIGTSTNLLVSSVGESHGLKPLGMFEFLPLGIIFLLVGSVYNLVFLPRLLPSRAPVSTLVGKYHMAPYLTEFRIAEGSPLIGSSCRKKQINERYEITVLAIIREGIQVTSDIGNMILQAGDTLLTKGSVEKFVKFHQQEKVLALTDIKLSEKELQAGDNVLVEGLVGSESGLAGKTLSELEFRRKYRAFVLAIGRRGEMLKQKIAHIRLRFADTMLMLMPMDRIAEIRNDPDLIILQHHEVNLRKKKIRWLAVIVIPIMMLLAATGLVDIMIAAFSGMFLLLVSKHISTREAYGAINWSVIVFIAAFIPFGTALETSGAALLIGQNITLLANLFPESLVPYALLSILYFITSLSTELISNNAAAIVLTPIAIAAANNLGIDARPLIFTICYAASASFMTPIGYKTNLMVYGPGKYRFTDYIRAGAPLNLIFWIIASVLIPVIWPF
ncbi:MAG: SLC13 family permease [Candidatus Marinimicrobia bacterium]|nr:SLC13 family permease [Candidatus Neomarinimicrobiota bacterium]